MKKIAFTLFLSNICFSAINVDPVIISSKTSQKASQMGSGATVIESKALATKNNPRVVDALNSASGVDITQAGIVGGQASIFLRGMESRHVLILIDGVRVYDPTNANRSFNTAILNAIDIEKIEILKGAQSVLYGSDAIAGVINIITRKGTSRNSLTYGTGYYDQLGINHTEDTSAGLFNLIAYLQEAGVDSSVAGGSEKDYSHNKGVTVNHLHDWERLEFNTTFKLTENFNTTDAQVSTGLIDDRKAYANNEHRYFKESVIYHHSDSADVFLDVSWSQYQRYNKYLVSEPSNYDEDDASGNVLILEGRVNETLANGKLLYGLNSTGETYSTDTVEDSLKMLDVFALRTLVQGNTRYELGLRHSSNLDYGSHLVYSLGYNYFIDSEQVFKLGHKTGFKAPSIYQQQDASFGNEDLAPEKTWGVEAEYQLTQDHLKVFTSLFYSEVDDFVQFVDSRFANEAAANYRGFELGFELVERTGVVGASLNLTQYELSSGKEAARRPNEIGKIHYLFNFDPEHSLNINWIFRGKSYDYLNSERKTLEAYDVWDLDYIYEAKNYKVLGSLKNIFNREYENVYGHSTLGTSFQINVTSYY